MIELQIQRAFDLAQATYREGNYPIGSMLVVDKNIFIEGKNQVVTTGKKRLHAEIDIIHKSIDYKGNKYKKVLFVTLEPCANCAFALIDFGVDEVYYILEDAFHGGKKILQDKNILVHKVDFLSKEYLNLIVDFLEKSGKYEYVYEYYKNKQGK